MLEFGSNNSLPAKYRIALALSLAFLVHTLVLSGVPSPLTAPDHHRQALCFELVEPGLNAAPEAAAHISQPKPVRNPHFDVPSQPEPVVTTQHSSRKTHPNEPEPDSGPSQPVAEKPRSTPAPPSATRTPSPVGSEAPAASVRKSEQLARITESPSERDPYLIKLATHLGRQLESERIPTMGALAKATTMEIELQLLGNGALTRARVIKSTGNQQIDDAAYRAALAASPYPEPPASNSDQHRFEIELVFTPTRL